MLKIILQTVDNDFLLRLDGDADYVESAERALMHVIPADALSASDSFLRVRCEEDFYFRAWLKAVAKSHHARMSFLPKTV